MLSTADTRTRCICIVIEGPQLSFNYRSKPVHILFTFIVNVYRLSISLPLPFYFLFFLSGFALSAVFIVVISFGMWDWMGYSIVPVFDNCLRLAIYII